MKFKLIILLINSILILGCSQSKQFDWKYKQNGDIINTIKIIKLNNQCIDSLQLNVFYYIRVNNMFVIKDSIWVNEIRMDGLRVNCFFTENNILKNNEFIFNGKDWKISEIGYMNNDSVYIKKYLFQNAENNASTVDELILKRKVIIRNYTSNTDSTYYIFKYSKNNSFIEYYINSISNNSKILSPKIKFNSSKSLLYDIEEIIR